MKRNRNVDIVQRQDGYSINFFAMASPCEVLVDSDDKSLVRVLAKIIPDEVWRIEDKYSRYDPDSFCSAVNQSNGKPVALDHESYLLMQFAQQCYELSNGLFDITSGILRKVWHFDGSGNVPDSKSVRHLLAYVGWHKVHFDENSVTLPTGMELDFGGIGKEYAVDRAMLLAKNVTNEPFLINLGGDLCANKVRINGQAWQVGIEHPGFVDKQPMVVALFKGALATSGDAKRFLLKDGVRYSHILNAKTGWPVENAPRSMTVVAPQCIQAGILATLSLLQGANAETYLTEQEVRFWAVR
ncbi:FAD:protein FMN transferase [Colwelliaceae bacterium 6471]